MASQKENVRTTTPQNINKNKDDEGSNTINALRREIDELKRKLLDKEENIDDQVSERDEGCDEIYELKLKLANAWNVLRNASYAELRNQRTKKRNRKAEGQPVRQGEHY